jgi:hypothetical protein
MNNSDKNISTTLFSTSSTAACHARGLDITSPLSTEAHTQNLRFRRHQQRDNPNNARGLDNRFASERGCDSTTTTHLPLHRRLWSHPIKAKFSSSKSRLLFTSVAPDTRGLRHKKSSCISLTSKKFAKARVADDPCRILENSGSSCRSSTNRLASHRNLGHEAKEKS